MAAREHFLASDKLSAGRKRLSSSLWDRYLCFCCWPMGWYSSITRASVRGERESLTLWILLAFLLHLPGLRIGGVVVCPLTVGCMFGTYDEMQGLTVLGQLGGSGSWRGTHSLGCSVQLVDLVGLYLKSLRTSCRSLWAFLTFLWGC